jgi:5-hydroxyisourate hydrolase-like protein (transthyretin family)
MNAHVRPKVLAAALLCVVTAAYAQSPQDAAQPGSIAGRVTIDGKPAAGVHVRLPVFGPGQDQSRPRTTTTDEEGRYTFTGVPPGQFFLEPYAPGLTAPGSGPERGGRRVALAPGENATNVDVELVRGGVITGRVTDDDGQPVIAEQVSLHLVGEPGKTSRADLPNMWLMRTDDRGIYRLFGVPPGRYLVSVGTARGDADMVAVGMSRGAYTLTYHPAASDEAGATVVPVEAGGEARGVDIMVGRREQTYSASGRIVDAATGKPAPNVGVACGLVREGDRQIFPSTFGNTTDSKGEFRVDGLPPGKYAAFVLSILETTGTGYSDPVYFEIDDRNVTGLEIKMHPGASISGVAVMEGVDDPAILARLSQVRLSARVEDPGGGGPIPLNFRWSQVESDGSFRIAGLPAGGVRLEWNRWDGPKGFSIVRIERDGVVLTDKLVLGAGEEVTGVRVVFGYGEGLVRGTVKLEGGKLPEGSMLSAVWRRAGGIHGWEYAQVDERGQFLIENLPAGEYEVSARVWSTGSRKLFAFNPDVKRVVRVPETGTVEATLIANVAETELVEAPR